MTQLAVLLAWAAVYFATLIWTLTKNGSVIVGGTALFIISLIPMIYGRWTTPSDWHDSPLMGIYYLPTMLAGLLSLIIVFIGLLKKMRQASITRRGAR